ncbi:hypothetical protein NPIL_571281 [Nephila pilipes]|uniref:Uncharacterized protein n=1 Tax=Nephila pilipes TaxID=299642 RepID=A0A8X6MLN8_NEPPI|nr:hypothetical protein NPIL_571281 [Nephila pilipes]
MEAEKRSRRRSKSKKFVSNADITAQKKILNEILPMEELEESIGNLKVKKPPVSVNIFPVSPKHLGPEAQNAWLLLYNTF